MEASLNETDILKAALYTACAQLAWHQDKRGNIGHIVHSAKSLMDFVSQPEERTRTRMKIERLTRNPDFAPAAPGGAREEG
jgi:hypothetical protein